MKSVQGNNHTALFPLPPETSKPVSSYEPIFYLENIKGSLLSLKRKRGNWSIFLNPKRCTFSPHCINQWDGKKYRNMWVAASVIFWTMSWVGRSAWKVLDKMKKCVHVTLSPLLYVLIPLERNWSGSHLRIHMDEAVGALQRDRSSANHSAVVEMVMVLQASYLTEKHPKATSRKQQQQLHCNLKTDGWMRNIPSELLLPKRLLHWCGLTF